MATMYTGKFIYDMGMALLTTNQKHDERGIMQNINTHLGGDNDYAYIVGGSLYFHMKIRPTQEQIDNVKKILGWEFYERRGRSK